MTAGFDELVAEGLAVDVSTWGAGFLPDRHHEEPLPWDYGELVRRYAHGATAMLDMGTGDGGRLRAAAPLPPHTVAYEEWAPTVPAAIATLHPIGVQLVRCAGSVQNTTPDVGGHPFLPFHDDVFDIVVNRHEAFSPHDVRRVLRPGGVFLTQQVCGDHGDQVRALFGVPPSGVRPWRLDDAVRQVEAAGFSVEDSGAASPEMWWTDVGAFVAYLRSVPWYLPDLRLDVHLDRLRELHVAGTIRTTFDVFWLAARAS
jgi:SAM-dependent methyltransferase